MAAENGSFQIIKKLLKSPSLQPDINYKGPDKKTPLYAAASEGHNEIVQILLRNGADVETRTINLRTPLHITSIRGDLSTTKTLVKHKANVNTTDTYGNTPCHYASQYGNGEVLAYLLKFNPKLYIKNGESKTPIDVAQNPEIIDIFGKYVNKIKQKVVTSTRRKSGKVNSN